jgi:hypothetical protein
VGASWVAPRVDEAIGKPREAIGAILGTLEREGRRLVDRHDGAPVGIPVNAGVDELAVETQVLGVHERSFKVRQGVGVALPDVVGRERGGPIPEILASGDSTVPAVAG